MSEECPRRCAGVVATACTQGKRRQHGKPQGVVRDDQPDAREGQAGRPGVAERFVGPLKPGNAGGGKGPQFKTDAIRSEGPGDWATYQLRRVFRNCRWRARRASTGQRGARPDTQFGPQFDRTSLVGDAAIDRSTPHMRLNSLNESVRSPRTNSNPSSAVLKSP